MAKSIDEMDEIIGELASPLEDAFDKRHISTDVLEAMSRLESSALQRGAPEFNSDKATQTCAFRERSLCFAREFLESYLGTGNKNAVTVWFEVARILNEDRHFLAASIKGRDSVSVVLSRASAAVLLALFLDSSEHNSCRVLAALALNASACAISLGGDEVSMGMIQQDQRELMESLVAAPSVGTWLALYTARLETCLNQFTTNTADSLEEVNDMATRLAIRSLTNAPPHVPFKEVAIGCLSLSLLFTSLVSERLVGQSGCCGPTRDRSQVTTLGLIFAHPMETIQACANSISMSLNL